jgi:hypothetical protein
MTSINSKRDPMFDPITFEVVLDWTQNNQGFRPCEDLGLDFDSLLVPAFATKIDSNLIFGFSPRAIGSAEIIDKEGNTLDRATFRIVAHGEPNSSRHLLLQGFNTCSSQIILEEEPKAQIGIDASLLNLGDRVKFMPQKLEM